MQGGSGKTGVLGRVDDPARQLVDGLAIPTLTLARASNGSLQGPVHVNRAFTRAFGQKDAGELTLDALWKVLCGDADPAGKALSNWQRALEALESSNEPFTFETKIVSREGTLQPVMVQVSQLEHLVLTHCIDLSAVRATARELVDDRNLLQRILDTSPSMIFVKDSRGRVRYVNQYTAQYYGTTPEQLIQSSTQETHKVDGEADGFVSDDQQVMRTGTTVEKDELNTAPDGTQHWFHTTKVPFTRSDGTVDVLGMATDVTARKQAETALRDSENKLRLVAGASGIGLWEWDIQKDAIEWDDVTLEIFGVTRETLPRDRDTYMKLVHPEDADKLVAAIRAALETGVYPPLEYRLIRPDGSSRIVLANAVVTFGEGGKPAKLIGGVRDITEQREFEDLRREAQKLEAIGQLSAGVAHNFNNMLTGIIPNIELALEGATPEVGELLRAAQDAALRASELVGQLVTFAGRAQAGPRRAEDMRGLVQRAVEMCRRTFDRSIELTTRLPGTEQLVVAAATELEQVLLNLLINARDAVSSLSIATPQVEVSVDVARLDGAALRRLGLAERDEYVRIQVRDNGVGIPEEDQTRIFEPFYTTKDPGRGTGLGLSTTLTTVREHGGAVECHSAQGVGSTFTVYLPSAPQKISRKPSSIPPARGGSETILLIDDEPAVRDVVERMLTRIGYRVEVASSGVDGLAMLENPALRDAVSLVIVDMSMPGLPGRVVCERLKQLYPRLRVAYFTGYAVESLEGADGVIHKPVTNEGLARSLRAILDGHGDSDRRGA